MTIATLIAAGPARRKAASTPRSQRVGGGRGSIAGSSPASAADLDVALSTPPRRATPFRGGKGSMSIAHPPGRREKRLLVADMDSTMIGQECIDELADYAGIKPQVAAITERAMQGELDFAGALRERVALLGGLEERAIDAVPRRADPPQSRRGDAGADDAGARRADPARVGRLYRFRRAGRRQRSASTGSRPIVLASQRGQADRDTWQGGSSIRRARRARWSRRASGWGSIPAT